MIICRTSGSSCEWVCRPLIALAATSKDEVLEAGDFFTCSVRRGQPGLLLQHAVGKVASKSAGSNVGDKPGKRELKLTASRSQRLSDVLLECLEATTDHGAICIPWSQVIVSHSRFIPPYLCDQVLEADMISDAAVLVTFRIRRRFASGRKNADKSGEGFVFRDATIELLVGPCPAHE
jgi:hypothetical protein